MARQKDSIIDGVQPFLVAAISGYRLADFILFCQEKDRRYQLLSGCYKGERDYFSVALNDWEWTVADLSPWFDNEESILVVDGHLHKKPLGASLMFRSEGTTGDPWGHHVRFEDIGRWQEIDKGEISALDGWTYDPATDTYYGVKPRSV